MDLKRNITLEVSEVVNGEKVKIGEVSNHFHIETEEDVSDAIDLLGLDKFCARFNYGHDVAARASVKATLRSKDGGKRAQDKRDAEKTRELMAQAKKNPELKAVLEQLGWELE